MPTTDDLRRLVPRVQGDARSPFPKVGAEIRSPAAPLDPMGRLERVRSL